MSKETESEVELEKDDRDQTVVTDWFPIFREGDYSGEEGKSNYTKKDIDQIVEEFHLSGRRSPIVFDHLNEEDLEPNAKPGPAAGFVIDLRATADKSEQYKGKRLLEARGKVSWWGSYRTRSGEFRNCSVGLYRHRSHKDGKERLALHHLALLGACVPGVEGLPEVIFSGSASNSQVTKVSFSLGNDFRISNHSESESNQEIHTNQRGNTVPEVINFSEHQAKLQLQKTELELEHSKVVQKFNEQISELEGKVESVEETLQSTKAELETTKAGIPAAVETARQEGIQEGEKLATQKAERLFAEQRERAEITTFCEGLRSTGRLTEPELKGDEKSGKPGMVDLILGIPAGPARESYKELLGKRPGLIGMQLFKSGVPEAHPTPESDESAQTAEAQRLVREGKFTNFREAFAHVRKGA